MLCLWIPNGTTTGNCLIRPESTAAPCPILSAFCAERVGNHIFILIFTAGKPSCVNVDAGAAAGVAAADGFRGAGRAAGAGCIGGRACIRSAGTGGAACTCRAAVAVLAFQQRDLRVGCAGGRVQAVGAVQQMRIGPWRDCPS